MLIFNYFFIDFPKLLSLYSTMITFLVIQHANCANRPVQLAETFLVKEKINLKKLDVAFMTLTFTYNLVPLL